MPATRAASGCVEVAKRTPRCSDMRKMSVTGSSSRRRCGRGRLKSIASAAWMTQYSERLTASTWTCGGGNDVTSRLVVGQVHPRIQDFKRKGISSRTAHQRPHDCFFGTWDPHQGRRDDVHEELRGNDDGCSCIVAPTRLAARSTHSPSSGRQVDTFLTLVYLKYHRRRDQKLRHNSHPCLGARKDAKHIYHRLQVVPVHDRLPKRRPASRQHTEFAISIPRRNLGHARCTNMTSEKLL